MASQAPPPGPGGPAAVAAAAAADATAPAPAAAATAAEEVAGLDRVLTRLALTDDDKLEKVRKEVARAVLASRRST